MKAVSRYNGPYVFGECAAPTLVGRKFMVIYYEDGTRGTILYSRYVVEKAIGRKLDRNEIVHHVDGDKTNDTLENLLVVSRKDHMKFHPDVQAANVARMLKSRTPRQHGTKFGWMKTGCRCLECSVERDAFNAERRRKRAEHRAGVVERLTQGS